MILDLFCNKEQTILDTVCNSKEEKQTLLDTWKKDIELTREHLERGDIPMPDGSWKSQPGNSRYECFIKKKLCQ